MIFPESWDECGTHRWVSISRIHSPLELQAQSLQVANRHIPDLSCDEFLIYNSNILIAATNVLSTKHRSIYSTWGNFQYWLTCGGKVKKEKADAQMISKISTLLGVFFRKLNERRFSAFNCEASVCVIQTGKSFSRKITVWMLFLVWLSVSNEIELQRFVISSLSWRCFNVWWKRSCRLNSDSVFVLAWYNSSKLFLPFQVFFSWKKISSQLHISHARQRNAQR